MKKPRTSTASSMNIATGSATSGTVKPTTNYSFDDTPKAFKRMLQRKNGDPELYKKFKQEQKDHTPSKRSLEPSEPQNQHQIPLKSTKTHEVKTSEPTSQQTSKTNPSAGFKTFRAKRKAHLQTRDLKKKLKKFDIHRELPQHNSLTRKNVRDVVQEPPKLHQIKKVYKKVIADDHGFSTKSWSDDDDLAEDREH